MQDYKKLVEALRSASTVSTAFGKLMADAADAIEALQAEVDKANKSADAYREMYFAKRGDITIENVRELDEIDCHFHSALIRLMYKRIEELESELQAQLPKRGEWVELGYQPNVHETRYRCSLCGRQVSILSGSGELLKTCPYCHCGAKMREVQDGK